MTDNNNELWEVIKDFPMYEVSDLGNIRNIKTGRILKPFYCWNGYLMVDLQKDSKRHHKLVHRLVGLSFIPNPYNLPCIDHIDGFRNHNCVDNLRWCSRKLNSNYDNHKPMSDELKAKYRKYHNRDKLKEYHKEYMKHYRDTHKDYMKLYYQAHKEQLSEYRKQYYQQHRNNKCNEQ